MAVIAEDAAREELDRIVEYFEVSPDGDTWEDQRKRLLSAIQNGRIILDVSKSAVVFTLAAPIKLENGQTLEEVSFHEPTAQDIKTLERYRENEQMSKAVHLASLMTGEPVGIINRMGSRDFMVAAAISTLFF